MQQKYMVIIYLMIFSTWAKHGASLCTENAWRDCGWTFRFPGSLAKTWESVINQVSISLVPNIFKRQCLENCISGCSGDSWPCLMCQATVTVGQRRYSKDNSQWTQQHFPSLFWQHVQPVLGCLHQLHRSHPSEAVSQGRRFKRKVWTLFVIQ